MKRATIQIKKLFQVSKTKISVDKKDLVIKKGS